MKRNTIESEPKPTKGNAVGRKVGVLLVGAVLAAGAVVRPNAQEPTVCVTSSARLEWPVPAEDCIVVGASSLASNAVWTPWPEPIFKRFDRLCMAAPMTNTHQFYGLVPGTQSVDDFDTLKEPYAARNDWIPWFMVQGDSSKFAFTILNEAFQIETVTPPLDGEVMIFPPGGGSVMQDFYASVDILEWASNQESALGIAGRVQGTPSAVNNMYLGSAVMNGAAGTVRLAFWNGEGSVQATPDLPIGTNSAFRLEFSVVGHQLTVRLRSLAEPQTVFAQGYTQDTRFTQGRVALWVNTRGSSSYRRLADNFFVTGTKP